MLRFPFREPAAGAALCLLLGVAGCDDLVGADQGSTVSLSFGTPAASSALSRSLGAAEVIITGGGHSLDLQEVEIRLSEVVLERAEGGLGGDSDGDSESDSDSDGPSNERFRSGPVTVDLPLEGGVVTPFSESVPEGFYEELELDVDGVRLLGTFDGQSFDVTLNLDEELEMDFEPPLEVSATEPFNITVSIDAASWLKNSDGTLVDPRQIPLDEDLREAIEDRIENSIKAFEDSDKDADDADSDSDNDSDSR